METPLKSFLLVSNILPQDNRPWAQYKRPVDTYDPCLILTGEAERYMVDAVGNYREASTGTTVLYPTYDLGSIVADMVTYEDE